VFDTAYTALLPQLPAGIIEKGETIEQVAVRELLEETGAVPLPAPLQFSTAAAINILCMQAAVSVAQGCAVLLCMTDLACCCSH
jgi:hypothetical protein